MADPGIKNVIVPKQELPAVNSENQYIVRYRIITDDRNRYSQWSPIFLVSGTTVTQLDADASVSGRVISIVWSDPKPRAGYDIFIKFDSEEYSYHGRASSTSYQILTPQDKTSFQYLIQTESMDKQVNNLIKIYESEVIPLV